MKKCCCACRTEKDVSDFSRCSSKKDGYQTRCKACSSSYRREYDATPEGAAKRKAWNNAYRKTPKGKALGRAAYERNLQDPSFKSKALERARAYRNSAEGKPRRAEWRRTYKAKNREKHLARKATEYAIRVGNLVRQPCEKCAAAEVHAHHDDYSKPLEVRWLCRTHHIAHHVAAGDMYEHNSIFGSIGFNRHGNGQSMEKPTRDMEVVSSARPN